MISKSTIKYIQSLQHKKFRDEYNVFTAEGPKVVEGLLESGDFRVKTIYALPGWVDQLDKKIYSRFKDHIEEVKEFELEKLATFTTANRVVAVFEKKVTKPVESFKNKWVLMLDDLQDPGNLGTIIRTADWFGIEHIICSLHTVDSYNSKVVQSTMASLGRVQLTYTDLPEWISAHQELVYYASSLHGKSINDFKQPVKGVIIIGNESKGISEDIMQMANHQVTIPKIGDAESLNAAVATGIILARFLM